MPVFRVGVIGHSGQGDYGHGMDAVWKDIPRAKVVSVADANEGGRAIAQQLTGAANAYADYRTMLEKEKLDVVAVGPRWVNQHHAMILAAFEHGCHVYTEKPFCRNLVEADELVRASEMRHTKLAIAHQTRWCPSLDVLKKEISRGIIGKVIEARGRGKEDRRGGGEDLWVLGSHIMDLMRCFLGDPQSCSSQVLQNQKPITKADIVKGPEGIARLAGDAVHARFTFAEGVTGYFDSTRNSAGTPTRFGLKLFGTSGVIEVMSGFPAICHVLQDGAWSSGRSKKNWLPVTSAGVDKPEPNPDGGLHAGNLVAVNNLLDCIEDPSRQPKCSVYDARWTIEMISSVFQSQRTGQIVSLPSAERRDPLELY